ncbi:MAG: flagellar export protein FliJ [Clostridia bacterium]|nr:flagellar export protein FliJ [Clostridia bacterium]
MGGFSFRLEPVLEHKRRLEDQAKQEFARAKDVERRATEELDGLENAYGDGQGDMVSVMRDVMDLDEVTSYQRYLTKLRSDIVNQTDLVTQLHTTSEEKRSDAVDGMRARKVVEKLKDRQYAQYVVEEKRVEQKQTDEFATTRYRPVGVDRKPR